MKKKIEELTKHLFKIKSEKDILRFENGNILYDNKPLNRQEREALVIAARELQENMVMKMLLSEMEYLACRKIYYESKSEEDILAGKMMLFFHEVWISKLRKLAGKV